MKKSVALRRFGAVWFCLSVLMIFAIWAQSINGFGPIDDHRFISTIFLGKSFGTYVMPELGRFIPATAQEYVLAAKLFGTSPHFFHFISTIKMVVCGLLLLHCLLITKVNNWVTIILWVSVIFSIGMVNAALRLQVGELNTLLLLLVFIWTAIVLEKIPNLPSVRKNCIATVGITAFTLSLFYKELIFVFALAFGVSELLRHYRNTQTALPWRTRVIIIVGVCYIVGYGVWRAANISSSYADFSLLTLWDVISLFARNDPFILFIVLPITVIRLFCILRNPAQHTLYDSFLVAASGYIGAYLALGMFNTYYLLPAYGFAVCGLAGVFADRTRAYVTAAVLIIIGIFFANTLPVALSDLQALRASTNNHHQFVHFFSEWIRTNPLPNSERRNLVFAGVNPGSGIEVLVSLKTFLASLAVPDNLIDVKGTDATDNVAISSFYGFNTSSKYALKKNDVLIFNPYQSSIPAPPLQAPSYKKIYQSGSEWALPRWLVWDWLAFCIFKPHGCMSNIYANMRYSGYTAFVVTRDIAPFELTPLKNPSYLLGPLDLKPRERAGTTKRLEVLVRNTGTEVWPASGALRQGRYVNLAYRWFNQSGQVVLEGNRAPLPEPVRPNDEAKVELFLRTPKKPGIYKLVISPVQEGVRWFSDHNGEEIEIF